jgi:hypothetical protein
MMDSQVMTLISNSLESQLFETFYCETTLDLWQAIQNQFSNKNNQTPIYQLKREITQISQETKIILKLIRHIRFKCEELKFYIPLTTDLFVIQEREEINWVYTFLVALDPIYEAVRAQVFLSIEKLIFDGVIVLIW